MDWNTPRDFDEQFEKMKKIAAIQAVIMTGVGLGLLGFAGWVVVKLLQHFSIV